MGNQKEKKQRQHTGWDTNGVVPLGCPSERGLRQAVWRGQEKTGLDEESQSQAQGDRGEIPAQVTSASISSQKQAAALPEAPARGTAVQGRPTAVKGGLEGTERHMLMLRGAFLSISRFQSSVGPHQQGDRWDPA